jgi:predicted dienelactone hydrolase
LAHLIPIDSLNRWNVPMKSLSLAVVASLFANAALADGLPGYDRLDVQSHHRAYPIAASVWYPMGSTTYVSRVGDNPIFKGTPVMLGAGVADGAYPLVLFSHGSGGNMDSIGWLSGALAKRGAMVLAVNHQGSTSGDSSPRRSTQMALRAQDLSAALDALLADPAFARYVDPARIYAVGFSLGGATALNLGGLRFDRERYADYCKDINGADCVFLSKGHVDFENLPEGFTGDARDARVSGVVAIDPGFTYVTNEESARAMDLPVQLISLGKETLFPAADLSETGSNLTGMLPDVTQVTLSPANHFTFLAECKPGADQMLAEEDEDPICSDPDKTDRAAIHAQIVDHIAQFMGL